jgi:hypothetical protein
MKTYICTETFNVDMVEYEGSDDVLESVVVDSMLVEEGSVWEKNKYHNHALLYNRSTYDWLDLSDDDLKQYFKEEK